MQTAATGGTGAAWERQAPAWRVCGVSDILSREEKRRAPLKNGGACSYSLGGATSRVAAPLVSLRMRMANFSISGNSAGLSI